MVEHLRVGVIGASGFVGSRVVHELRTRAEVVKISAPRFDRHSILKPLTSAAYAPEELIKRFQEQFAGLDVVINAAGNPDASSNDRDALACANTVLPFAALLGVQRVGVSRFIHVSSAVVQGDRPVLDSSLDVRPFSPYSESKAVAEQWLTSTDLASSDLVVYRPPSVHARGRGVTRKISAIAKSPLRSVAGAGDFMSPQALLPNVASAIAFLATTTAKPPLIVHHPWEGLTSRDVLWILGGKEPRHLPAWLAGGVTRILRRSERILPTVAPHRRRIELMWWGQEVAPSWLTSQGWEPPESGVEAWRSLTER